jgi:hypothetical protein
MKNSYFTCEKCNTVFLVEEGLCNDCKETIDRIEELRKEYVISDEELELLDISDPDVLEELEETLSRLENENDEIFSNKVEEYINDKKIKKRIAKIKKKLNVK